MLRRSHDRNRKELPAASSSEKFNYTILAPYNFRANTDYTFTLSIHDAQHQSDQVVLVRVSIEDNDDARKFQINRNVAMNPNVTEVVSIPIGNVPANREYKLVLKGISGTDMEHSARLHLLTQSHIIFIQTDKGIYKPNDCVKFRVLVLDWELKAASIEKNELIICISVSFFFITKLFCPSLTFKYSELKRIVFNSKNMNIIIKFFWSNYSGIHQNLL